MKDLIKILKVGAAKGDYPYYCQYIHFAEDKIQTCNGSVYVDVEVNPFRIRGCINLFVLENVLNYCEDPHIFQNDEGTTLTVTEGSYVSNIAVDSVTFPQHPPVKIDFVTIDEEFLYLLKSAIKYTGDGLLSYIYIDYKYILAVQDKQKMFYHKHNFDIPSTIAVNRKILGMLSEGIEMGTTEHNTVVQFDNGKIIFQVALFDNFPNKYIVNLVEDKPDVHFLCGVAPVQDAVQKVSSVLFNEMNRHVQLTNKDNKLVVRAESAINGISTHVVESSLRNEFMVSMEADFLHGVDLDYDIFVDIDSNNFVYLTNGKSEIILAGVRG